MTSAENLDGAIALEAKVEWVHPGCKFVLNEAVVSLTRSSHSSPFESQVLEQRTLADEKLAFEKIADDEAAIAAIATAVSQFNRLGAVAASSVELISLENLVAILGAEVCEAFDSAARIKLCNVQVSPNQTTDNLKWLKVDVEAQWCAPRLAVLHLSRWMVRQSENNAVGHGSLRLERGSSDWHAAVLTLMVINSHTNQSI